jgi:hypothetical protein
MWRVFRLASGVIVVSCVLEQLAGANGPAGKAGPANPLHSLVCPDALLRACCPHYCPKPLPCINCFCRGCCPDNYCKKPCPCVPCYPGSCLGECFCKKPCPDLCRPLAADYFTCPKRSSGCDNFVGPNQQIPAVRPEPESGVGGQTDQYTPPPAPLFLN